MRLVWLRTRGELRARLRGVIATVVLLGIAGGMVLAVVAGARRTDTALARMERDLDTPDVVINDAWGLDRSAVAALPDVTAIGSYDLFINFDAVIDGRIRSSGNDYIVSYAPADDALGNSILRTKLIDGRRADPSDPTEATASYSLAQRFGVKVGSKISVEFLTWAELLPVFTEGADLPPDAGKPGIPVTVVGIDASPGFITDLPPLRPGAGAGRLLLTPAFYEKYGPKSEDLVDDDISRNVYIAVRLAGGEGDRAAFEAAVSKLQGFGEAGFHTVLDHTAQTQRSLNLQAVALWSVGGLGALVLVLVFGQTMARQTFLDASDHPIVVSLGATPRQMAGVSLLKALLVGAAGALLAAASALAASPVFPLGLGRVVDPALGLAVDPLVLGVGMSGIVIASLLAVAVPAARAARGDTAAVRARSGSVAIAASLPGRGLPASAIAGMRLALERGSGRGALPVRSTIAGIAIGLVGLVTALSFGASLDHLLATPRLYGWTWDVTFGQDNIPDLYEGMAPILDDTSAVAAWAYGSQRDVYVDGRRELAFAMDDGKGRVEPAVIAGRAPRAHREILLGARSLRALGKRIGDAVTVEGRTFEGESATGGTDARPTRMRMTIVGTGVPVNGEAGLGYGASMTFSGLRELFGADTARNLFHVRFRDDLPVDSAYRELSERLEPTFPQRSDSDDLFPRAPANIADFGGIKRFPLVLASVLGVAAMLVLTHMLASSARRRRRDLAILKTLGFTKGSVRRAVAWQASTLVIAAALIAIPVGAVAARWAWMLVANALGIRVEVVQPWLALAAIVPGALLLGNLIASWPARVAARTQPAAILRVE